jgi:hypothetical protein
VCVCVCVCVCGQKDSAAAQTHLWGPILQIDHQSLANKNCVHRSMPHACICLCLCLSLPPPPSIKSLRLGDSLVQAFKRRKRVIQIGWHQRRQNRRKSRPASQKPLFENALLLSHHLRQINLIRTNQLPSTWRYVPPPPAAPPDIPVGRDTGIVDEEAMGKCGGVVMGKCAGAALDANLRDRVSKPAPSAMRRTR